MWKVGEIIPHGEMEEKALKKSKWALLAVLLGIMVAMSGCFGGSYATGGVTGVVYAPKEDSDLHEAERKLLVKDLVIDPPPEGYVPLAGAVVKVEGTGISARTDAKGRFTLTGVRVGPRTLVVWHDLYKPVRINVTIIRDIIVSVPSSVKLQGKGFYLLIGVGDFDYEQWEPLGFSPKILEPMAAPAMDVNLLRNILEYDNALAKGEIAILLDTEATYERLRSSLEELVELMDEDDYLVVYFSGHGLSRDDFGYDAIALADGPITDLELRDWVIEDLFKKNHLEVNDVTLILDTCYSGAFADGVETLYDDPVSTKAFRKPGYTVLASSRSYEESWYFKTYPELSIFTNYLADALETGRGDLNGDRLITARELYNYVGSRTQQATNGNQNVYLWPSYSNNVITTYPY